ncbi:TerB family tellurite resistance protein [Phreatobacter sp.]|uniref:tellurite resistance TerB family protein n=1 Tax=Phreatobacter sp. TaxID=1966341 RepID=UPI003F729DB3
MLDRFFSLFADSASELPEPFGEGDYRLAAAVLLVHAMTVDGRAAPIEMVVLEEALSTGFDLSLDDTRRLIGQAQDAEQREANWTGFADILARTLDEPSRRRIIDMMWRVVLADGRMQEMEEAVVERAAQLLGVPVPDRPGGAG